ncbi:HAMP domain-containing sensor histidine kinase [Paenibacillus glycanilyticus]|uniref:HAMP domain-containing sensor histidine kinase n=1 Tax=Paenibacillus glycanilyticus TaxID=126569 RepID=UPI000FD9A456|nr:HAMP domain-containing sensor histidine kinase [Paenibacillus glycanilyticus]
MVYIIPIIFLVFFLIAFYFFTRRIIKYISLLAEGLGIISKGNLNYRVPVNRKDELGNLAINMNEMAEKLGNQKEKETANEELKMNLITGISHDLRTPLTSMIGYLDLLRNHSFLNESEYNRFVNNAYRKAEQLKKLIDDLFVYTRISSGNLKLIKKEVDLRALLEQILFEFVPIANEQNSMITSQINVAESIVYIDPEQVVRIIDNLLMNALKYAVAPKVIDVTLECDEFWIYLTIENEGECITQEQESKLFERFYKTEHATKNPAIHVGAGLGLAISRQLAELQSGKLELVHKAGHYAFTLLLPLRHMKNENSHAEQR